MKKITNKTDEKDEMRAEYDFSKMKLVGRGIYAERYRSGTNIVLLDRDVRKAFPNDREITEALRQLAKVRRKASRAKKSQSSKTPSRSRRAA